MSIELDTAAVDQFFADARERHAVYLRRTAGAPRPWTQDPVMQQFRITNVFRELDKTTTWLRSHVRDPLRNDIHVLPAVALFRWFNLIRSGETIFLQPSLFTTRTGAVAGAGTAPDTTPPAATLTEPVTAVGGLARLLAPEPGTLYATPWQEWLATEDTKALEWPLRKQGAPWVTGAYMIRTPIGMDKLEGVVSSFNSLWNQRPKFELSNGRFVSMGWRDVAKYCVDARDSDTPVSLKRMWDWLTNFYGLGAFMAYEIVTDLRHTILLDKAPDINTWANPGPGALRGANILIRGANRGRKGRLDKSSVAEAKFVMDHLLELSRDTKYWPQPAEEGSARGDASYAEQLADVSTNGYRASDWPMWELHEVEMWLCETAKLVRTRLGYGRPRGNFAGVS